VRIPTFIAPIVEKSAPGLRCQRAEVAELADAPDSKSGEGNLVWVRVPPSASREPPAIALFQNAARQREARLIPVGATELLAAAIEKARGEGLHKLSLEVFPHNDAAIALYRKFGFVEEGHRVKHYRRASGELWDSIVMGLLL
jgi:L-amino acid N-acyltransferase YncA